VPFALDCLAIAAALSDNQLSAARLFGAADGARKHMGFVRFKVLDEGDDATIAALRDASGCERLRRSVGAGRGAVHPGSHRLCATRSR
jgi:hypothetical protein